MKIEMRRVDNLAIPILYYLIRKNVKNINLRIDADGNVIVSASNNVGYKCIDAFITKKARWIYEKQDLQKKRKQQQFVDKQNSIYILGKPYDVKIVEGNYQGIKLQENIVYVYVKYNSDPNKFLRQHLNTLCRKECMQIVEQTFLLFQDYRIAFPNVKYRLMKSRWGSCTPSKNQICLNYYLIHQPKAFIEYVILHEFAHFIQPNHSKAFYQLIENRMPDYKARIALAR